MPSEVADTKFINGKGFLGARSDLSVWIVSWKIYWFLTVASKYPCSLVARLLTFMPSCLAVTNLAVKTQTGGRQCSRSSSSNQDQNCSAGRQGLVVPCLFCLVLCRSPAAVACRYIYVKFGSFVMEGIATWTSHISLAWHCVQPMNSNKLVVSFYHYQTTKYFIYFSKKHNGQQMTEQILLLEVVI